MNERLDRRASGILLHPTSLPGPAVNGDLGPAAVQFVEFLAAAGQSWWQMLPIGPPGKRDSPYDGTSAFAGSPWLVSLENFRRERLLEAREVPGRSPGRVGMAAAAHVREPALRKAFARWERGEA